MQNTVECWNDPQLRHRDYWVEADHSSLDKTSVEWKRFRLARIPARVLRAGPTLGEHNWEVLNDVLGYDEDRIAELLAQGLLD